MTLLLDTNVLLRHFTGTPPDQAGRATTFLRAAAPGELVLVDLVAAELVFILRSVYQQPPQAVARMLRSVLALPAVRCEHLGILHRTVELFEAGQHFVDAYLMAAAEADGIEAILSFDRGIRPSPDVRRVEP